MKDIWVISDTHFGHSNILKFRDSNTNRLIRGDIFSNVNEMNDYMIEKWNSVVKPGDKVYHLGDVFFGSKEDFSILWPKLNGSKRLVVGNHDDIKYLCYGGYFSKVSMWRLFSEFGLLLTHVPVHSSNLKVYVDEVYAEEGDVESVQKQFLNVHGHIHQNPSPEGPYKNVSVEAIHYTPVNIEEIRIR